MRRVIGWVGVGMIVCVFVAGFIAYFVYGVDPQTNIMYDGFRRQLYPSPWFMRLMFGQDRLWAGWFWFIADMAIFWGSIGLGFSLAGWGLKET